MEFMETAVAENTDEYRSFRNSKKERVNLKQFRSKHRSWYYISALYNFLRIEMKNNDQTFDICMDRWKSEAENPGKQNRIEKRYKDMQFSCIFSDFFFYLQGAEDSLKENTEEEAIEMLRWIADPMHEPESKLDEMIQFYVNRISNPDHERNLVIVA